MFKVIFYRSVDGQNFVKEFLDNLQESAREKVIADIMFLEEYGHQARRPRADYLKDKIHELRTTLGHLKIRLLYFFDKKLIVLTHGFYKKSDAVPPNEIAKAVKIKRDYFNRKG